MAARRPRGTPRPSWARSARRRSARCATRDRSRSSSATQRARGERVREVRAAGDGAAVAPRSSASSRRVPRGSPAARASTRSKPVGIGVISSPMSPMSWYSGSHETPTSSSSEDARPRRSRRCSSTTQRCGSITPFGSRGGPARELQDRERVGVVGGPLPAPAASRPRARRGARSAGRPGSAIRGTARARGRR